MVTHGESKMILDNDQVKSIVAEIRGQAEVDRRALAKKRIDIYKDGGKAFLIEQIRREFDEDALREMRLVPLNLLKKVVNKLAGVYKKPPQRKATDEKDQALVDYYVKELDLNIVMAKLNRYLVLSSNAALYIRPHKGELKANVVPNYQYSLVPEKHDQCKAGAVIFSAFTQSGRVTPNSGTQPATGVQSYSQDSSFRQGKDLVDSNERDNRDSAPFLVFWTEEQHFTTNGEGLVLEAEGIPPEMQAVNPIEELSVVLVARDRDNEVWAKQGEDLIDGTIAIQMGWTDVMTIAKHQGFSLLTVTSPEKPQKLNIGINRAIWNKQTADGKAASVGYVTAQSNLEAYKGLLSELLGLLLSTNGMNPGSVSGGNPQTFTSGFHALIAAADSLEAVEADKPVMLKAEREAWELIALWHNWMFEQNMLEPEMRVLGKFSEKFDISIQFADIKPLESEDDVIKRIQSLRTMGLLTRLDAMKKLNPELSDDQAKAKLAEIDAESQARMAQMQTIMTTASGSTDQTQGDEPILDDSNEKDMPMSKAAQAAGDQAGA